MWHANDDFVDAQLATAFDNLLHCRDQAFATIKAETLGAHVFDMQEFFKTFGLDKAVQDRLAAVFGECDFFAVAFDAFFQPARFFGVGDVHVLQCECAAISTLHDRHNLGHSGHFEAKNLVDKDRTIHISGGKAIRCRI